MISATISNPLLRTIVSQKKKNPPEVASFQEGNYPLTPEIYLPLFHLYKYFS